MTKDELIKALEQYPDDIIVCYADLRDDMKREITYLYKDKVPDVPGREENIRNKTVIVLR